MQRILITGGAGFIGSHVADELVRRGYEVRALDRLVPQVHGEERARPDYLHEDVELVVGDVRDPEMVAEALEGVDAVYHLAASVGVGQSMYEVADYTRVNNVGTAVLMEALIDRPVDRVVVASSMSIYGEGLYRTSGGELKEGYQRPMQQLKNDHWELGQNGTQLEPVPTPETKTPDLASVYALSKYDQERMCLILGRAYDIPTVALRFFNVYGPRQALSNPYTGVLAIFASRYLNGKPPLIFEDGYQQRDFVSVYDVAQACRLALETPAAAGEVFNVGSGHAYTIREIADRLGKVVGREDLEPQVTHEYRVGDIRHCFADISKARQMLGYEPQVKLEEGLREMAQWLEHQVDADAVREDSVEVASAELSERGLAV